MMTCVVNFVFALYSSKVLSRDGLVGGNPTMNTPRLRMGGGLLPLHLFYFLPVLVFLYSYFVCDSASEFGAMGSTSFFGVECEKQLFPHNRGMLRRSRCALIFL